jgi:hypothetical protein
LIYNAIRNFLKERVPLGIKTIPTKATISMNKAKNITTLLLKAEVGGPVW